MGVVYLDHWAEKIRSKVPSSKQPRADDQALFRIYAVLLLAKGEAVSAEDVHNAWSAWMGEIDPDHAALVPFSELPPETAADDQVYVMAIQETAQSLDE